MFQKDESLTVFLCLFLLEWIFSTNKINYPWRQVVVGLIESDDKDF